MRALPFFVLTVLLIFPYASATADTLRCGSYLIQDGDDAFSVIAKCGKPTERMTISEPVYASTGDGGTFAAGAVALSELWRYDRGPGQFPVIMKISDGVVQHIHFVKSPR
jgi:hypothetical protein